ncbi:protein kinase [bacterium]|nr:protein kinase [candidate division CSSED10-310 bacterium]
MNDEQVRRNSKEPWEPGRIILNSFTVEKVLGIGGMSTVYLVRRLSDDALFSLKAVQTDYLNLDGTRQDFFRELRTWIDLPEYPNITQCRFFKTIDKSLGIFAEYVDGGTLRLWIDTRKLTDLERILDVMIQCAGGLQVAHDAGVIHQDVKPTNILMTSKGVPKITDFGIASIMGSGRGVAGESDGEIRQSAALGYTLEYCSPEQFNHRELDHRTDIWSFGVVMMEMLTGKPITPHGYLAGEALQYDLTEDADQSFPGIPDPMKQVLNMCLKKDPTQRWNSFNELGESLRYVYYYEIGKEYNQPVYEIRQAVSDSKPFMIRKTITGVNWDDPMEWLNQAESISGETLSVADDFANQRPVSRTSRALADLQMYETAQELFQRVIRDGNRDIEVDFARLLLNKALIQESLSDWKGAIETRNRAVKILESQVYGGAHPDLINYLAGIYLNQGWALIRTGEIENGIKWYDKALSIREHLTERHEDPEIYFDLAKVYMNKGFARCRQKNSKLAQENFDRAEYILKFLIHQCGIPDHYRTLAIFYMNRAVASKKLARPKEILKWFEKAGEIARNMEGFDYQSRDIHFISTYYLNRAEIARDFGGDQESIRYFDKAIQMLEYGIYQEENRGLLSELASAYAGKAQTFSGLGRFQDAMTHVNEAIRIRERLLGQEGREEQADDLSKMYQSKAFIYINKGEIPEAVRFFDKSIQMLKWLIEQNGQIQLREYLSKAYLHLAALYRDQEEFADVIQMFDPAIDILKHLVYQENRRDLLLEYANAVCRRAEAWMKTGNLQNARRDAKEGMMLLQLEYKRTRNIEVAQSINWVKLSLGSLLK